ncbi:phosphatase PAP2 family protein [Segatella baroniae B14]|nr:MULTISPECIES: phosphatase PAP2 family protein [Segatella]MBQ3858029.1 phosphatase PAP2 family protein [Prevotella sp.]MDR4930365.1 phosphatase PAP2 family protein [Segatella bryantii]MEE3413962.1 phosphatase PAP2 family protein [Prevotella sp.]UKK74503.1 phosphatase PAP2 family protein [Segatella bryantii]UKK77196.1 phosphatase PAP2 family protein [Segatella bryantii]
MFLEYFKIEKNPKRGLLALEWAVLAYMAFTLLMIFFTYTRLHNPQSMIWGRVQILVMTLLLWAVYRMVPCRMTKLMRIVPQLGLLAWWYPDTYELNRIFMNMDYIFAGWEQSLFGFQPALVFAKNFPSHIISELMDMGYFMYYPIIAYVALYYFFLKYQEFERCTFILMAAFLIYYVIFIFVPVAGPTFYYEAVGLHDIANGVFPALGDYFNTHTDCLPSPGDPDGLFYRLVEDAKDAGERPTAAFPSSHVGISTVCMLLAIHTRKKWLVYSILPIYLFLCMATVYIQAHYLIDAIAGMVSAVVIYFVLLFATKNLRN